MLGCGPSAGRGASAPLPPIRSAATPLRHPAQLLRYLRVLVSPGGPAFTLRHPLDMGLVGGSTPSSPRRKKGRSDAG